MALELAKIGQNYPCLLCNLNIFQWIIIKLSDIVCYHNLMANFNKQPDPMKHFRVMALELSKIAPQKNNSMDHHQTWCIKLSDNVCKHNLSTTFNNQPDLMKHLELWPLS